MSVQKIDYEDKIGLQNDPNVPDKNKVLDEDMNEIKSVVNNNADELTTAQQNIEDLQSGQGTASGDITSLKNRVTALETDNTTNKQDINTLKADNETNKQNIANKVDKVEGKGLSTEDFTAELKTKLEGLNNYDDTEIKEDIAEIQAEQATQNQKIEQLDDNQIHITTEKSSNINVQDASGQNAKINVFGNSIQNGEPTPKAPVNIENVTGDIDITVCNKNLFNKDTAKQNFILSATGAELESEGAFISDYILVKKGINYFSNTRGYANAGFYNLNKEFIERKDLSQNALFSPDNDYYIRLNGKIENINTFQFEIGTTSISYVEHEEQIITFHLEEGQKMYEGSYSADDGIHHKRKQIELDGTENIKIFNWSTPHEKTTMFSVSNIISKKTDSIKLCNYFKVVKNTVENLNKDEEYCLSDITGAIHFSISNEIATTVEQFKNWLAQKKQEGKSLIVEYDLLEEEIEEYTEEQQEAYNQLQNAKTYKTVTNVFTDNAEVEMEYVAHTKTYIDNKVNNMQNQINTINELLSTTNTSALLLDNLQTDLESEVL